jgi:Xaa-Pro aminopeptidase
MTIPPRLRQLRLRMEKQGSEALLLTHGPDVRYLTGFSGSNALLLVLPRRTVLLTDGRYRTQARQQTAGSGVQVRIGKQIVKDASLMLVQSSVSEVFYDPAHTSMAELERLQAFYRDACGSGLKKTRSMAARFFRGLPDSPVALQRETKDAGELALIEQAALLGCRVFDTVLPFLKPGVTERAVAAELEYAARRMGADSMSFETIVASGLRSALPHGHATDQTLPRRGFVTLDFGVMLMAYCSDMTRTVHIGKPTTEERHAYQAVLEAEQAGVAAIRPGIEAGDVDTAARSVLRRHNLARYFAHSTGHGVGLEIHEGPRLGAKCDQQLAEGMVLTVEPGVYLPGRFGIRIEDMVVVESGGCRVLTATPRELLIL